MGYTGLAYLTNNLGNLLKCPSLFNSCKISRVLTEFKDITKLNLFVTVIIEV